MLLKGEKSLNGKCILYNLKPCKFTKIYEGRLLAWRRQIINNKKY